MERLTTNKDVSEMGMYELAHNSCYSKDGKARYRDFGTDIDARELAIKLLEEYADIPNEFTCDDDFDDFMLDSLQYGTDEMLGLIALFYRNLWAMANLYERLKEYEDLEEEGLLLKLPCKIGERVYEIYRITEDAAWEIDEHKIKLEDIEKIGKTVFLTQREAEIVLKQYNLCFETQKDILNALKETWFPTKTEAEKALYEMEEEK